MTEYGLLRLDGIRIDSGRTVLGYDFTKSEIAKDAAMQADIKEPPPMNIFPTLYLRDSENNILKSSQRTSNNRTGFGEISFNGTLKNLDQPVELAIIYNEKIIDWHFPIRTGPGNNEVIEINRSIVLNSGVFNIKKLISGSASTSLEYDFVPVANGENTTTVSPFIKMILKGREYEVNPTKRGLSGKLRFQIPVEHEEHKDIRFNIFAIEREVKYGGKISLESGNIWPAYELEGARLEIQRFEAKDGKTYIDLVIDEGTRDYYDINVSIYSGEKHVSCSVGGHMEFNDLTKTTIGKSIEISGEYEKIVLIIEELVYMDLCMEEFSIEQE